MAKSFLKKYSMILCVIFAILTAMGLRQIEANAPLNCFFGMLRAAIYIELFIFWGVSIHRRIIHPQVSRYLIAISALMVFWIIIRTIRYSLNECIWLMRYLWYLYYLPMLLIPLLAVFVALSLGKAERFPLTELDGIILHTYCYTFVTGANQRFASACICFSGRCSRLDE